LHTDMYSGFRLDPSIGMKSPATVITTTTINQVINKTITKP